MIQRLLWHQDKLQQDFKLYLSVTGFSGGLRVLSYDSRQCLVSGQPKSRKSGTVKQTIVPPELLNASRNTVTAPCTCSPSSLLPALPAVPGGEFQFHSTLMGKFCFWTVEKSSSATTPFPFCKLQRSGLESLCQLFSPFLWRGCGCEMQSLECYYTTLE